MRSGDIGCFVVDALRRRSPIPVTLPPSAEAAVLRAVDLTRVYTIEGVEVHALRGVSVSIARGQMVAIMGPSGSGKSTLLHILGGIDLPSSGRLWLEGVELGGLSERGRTLLRRRRLGFVFQSFNLLPMLTAVENVALPLLLDGVTAREATARAEASLELVRMSQRTNHLPTQLSGGEQQRVAIARSLVFRPALLLADEPTGSLDSSNTRDLMCHLRQMVDESQQTIVLVTHESAIAEYADRVIQLLDGRIC